MKGLLLVVFIFLCNLSYAHTGKIKGTLKFKDGRPVSFAIVYIQTLEKYAVSNEDGRYEIEQVPFGKYVLETKTIEADPVQITVELDRNEITLPIVLTENSEVQLEDVIVWGKSEIKKLKDEGFAVGLIDTKKLEFQSIQTNELLDRTAGVRIRQSGGMGSDVQYNINGLTGNSVRIFIDGIPARNYGSSFSLSSIPPATIERIEVYKGVVPTHLSEDALGGAINVVLKKSARNNLSTSYSFGSFNTHRWEANGNYRHEKTGFSAGGSIFYNYTDNSYKVWGDQVYVSDPVTGEKEYVKVKRFHDSYRSMGINTQFGFTDVKWADSFLLGILFSDMHKDVQHGATMHIVYGNRATEQSTQMVSLKYDKKDILKGLDVNAFASFSNSNRMVIDTIPHQYNWYGEIKKRSNGDYVEWSKGGGEGSQATLAENKEQMFAGRTNIAYRIHSNHKISGHYLVNYFTRNIDDPLMPQAQRDLTDTRYLTKNILSANYESKFLDDKLKSSLFFKYYVQNVRLKDFKTVNKELVADNHDRTMKTTGYGLAIAYEVIPRFVLRTSAEKALRMPEGTEILGNTSENISTSYDLKPESSYNVNVGFNAGPFIFRKHQVGVDVNVFYRDIRDMISRSVSNSNDDTYGYENLGKVMSKGVDVEFYYSYNDKVFFSSNLSNFNARFNLQYDEHGTEYVYYKSRLRNAPYFTWNNNLEYRVKNFIQKGSVLSLIYNLSYVHEFFRDWENLGSKGKDTIPTQALQDVTVTYSFPKSRITCSFDAKNIFDEQVFDNWALQKPGRAFYIKISCKIF